MNAGLTGLSRTGTRRVTALTTARECGAVLPGNRLDIDVGERVMLIGVLRLVDNPRGQRTIRSGVDGNR